MRPDLTDITLVIDRSGSMGSIRSDAEGGINAFITGQRQTPGEVLVSLLQFDMEYEFLCRGVKLNEVRPYRLECRGGTALLDALGRAIHETGDRLAKLPESQRPGLVVIVVMTDGQENSSREYTKAQIKKMIEHQQSVYNWQFTFLGANQDSFGEAGSIGIAPSGTADFSPDQVGSAWSATLAKVGRMRQASVQGDTIDNSFTLQERDQMT
jgi:uncharacterized protein YegL